MFWAASVFHFAVLFTGLIDFASCSSLWVTCGSVIKLQHANTKYLLHSHEVAYGRGSQQQSVTGFEDGGDANSLWLIQSGEDTPCTPGAKLKKNSKIKLKHTATKRWLHSHLFRSPLSGNQEVSAYGSDEETDGGDVWTVEWDSKPKIWKQDAKIRLKHQDTGVYLHSHDMKYGDPIGGQQEVCGVARKDANSEWKAVDGIYFPPEKPAEKSKDEL